ncbi:MAG: PAS domain-containing protein [Candidatus Eisenbacteria bacterium]|nr:PAS domain-containing protein [Candidatus Eisenbacteria bacterium]
MKQRFEETNDAPFEAIRKAVRFDGAEEEALREVAAEFAPAVDLHIEAWLPDWPDEERALYRALFFEGPRDGDYPERRKKIRERVLAAGGNDGRGAAVWAAGLIRLAEERFGGDPVRLARAVAAIGRAALLDREAARAPFTPEGPGPGEILKTIGPGFSLPAEGELEEGTDPAMVLVLFRDGRFADANQTALDALGFRRDEIRRLTIRNVLPEEQHARVRMHLERVARSGHDHVAAHIIDREGQATHVEMISSAIYDDGGRLQGTRIFLRDLTHQKRLEEEKLRWERLVAVGSMAAKVAHEIRNPLSSISLNVELLMDQLGGLPDEDRAEAGQLVNSILSEIDRLTNVIEEYLSFGRLPSPSLEPVRVRDFLRSVSDFVRPDLRSHGIGLTIDVLPGTPRLLADTSQARQCLLNLFRNAQEAMNAGGEIQVTAGPREGNVLVEVRDTGAGIPRENLSKIFDPFYTTKDFGTGLGLAFVQQVMREHGGRVVCRSREGKGTVFGLYFPADEA